ncbi:hypothetical protein MYP_187 [Sporocytophaga myxococcoides]|uniref:Uncharacterized protein n=1 Tax=Sporocytophaga myxococcoides TaxID=153721 RepID=A0A098L8E2_9BACT|nr:hypothetical protein [Sporocytophaga myxococcoides]GAL82961.1 hypothetical protein MYP_187 [Sporocytophaga myxococcoides]
MKTNFIKSFFALCILFFAVTVSFSQDLILKRGGDEIYGKVLEIKEDKIFYKNNVNDSLIISIDKKLVFMVKFENGAKIVFDNPIIAEPVTVEPIEKMEERSGPLLIDTRARGLYYYNGRYYSIKRLSPVLLSTNDKEIREHLSTAKAANIGSWVLFGLSFPLGTIGLVGLAEIDAATNSAYRQDPKAVPLAAAGIGSFLICQIGNIVLKKVVRDNSNNRAVERYNQLQLLNK